MSFNQVRALLILGALMTVLAAVPLQAAPQTAVIEGRVVRLDGPASVTSLALPVRAVASFGIAGDRILLGAEPGTARPGGTDAWTGMNLWSAALDGGDARRLTSDKNVLRAVWSDAAGLVAIATTDMEIRLMDLTGKSARKIAARGTSPAFSPDGKRLVYAALPASWRPGSLPGGFDLRVVDLASGADRRLTTGYDDAEPLWTPDGRSLLFLSGGRTGLTSLWRIGADGSGLTQITNAGLESAAAEGFVPNPSANLETRWSEDGTMLLYGARYTDAGEVIVLDFDRRWNVLEARDLGAGHSPAWSDRGTVAVVRAGAGALQATELPVRGEGVRKVISLPGISSVSAQYRPGRDVEFLAGGVEIRGEKTHTNPPRYRFPLSFQPGGTRYFYDNDSSGGILSWKCNGETYNGHRGTDLPAACGNSVLAGHDGPVSARNDGCPNVGFVGSTCGGGFGNYVKLNNGNNWFSIYAHMQSGTPIGFVTVACGQYIGTSYTSGNSSGCHLHFEVQHYGYPSDDPFAGSCSGPESFWCNQNGDGAGLPGRVCC